MGKATLIADIKIHVMSKLYGIAITINNCLFEFKTYRKKKQIKNPKNYKNVRSRINFISP